VGLGSFGKHHARHYGMNADARLIGVADVDEPRARAAGAQYGCAGYVDHRDLIGKVDAVSITVPARLHHRVARDFLDAGVHVLIEKPITADSTAARDLIDAADKANAVLQVGHLERFSPVVDALRQCVTSPRRVSASRRTPWTGRSTDVDVILDLMIHDIDLALLLAGRAVTSVAASGVIGRSGRVDEAEAWLTFAGGAIATLSASRVADEGERRIVVTEPATVFSGDLGGSTLTSLRRGERGAEPVAIPVANRDALGAEIAAFLTSVRTGATPDVDGAAGLAALEIAERIQASIADAGAVRQTESMRR
jgi:predicted dehydrogenase